MHDTIAVVDYADEQARRQYLGDLYRQIHEGREYDPNQPEVFRSPGSFILEFATGALSFDQIVDFVSTHKETLCGCVDERLKDLSGTPAFTSHEGCGAANAVFGMAQEKQGEAYQRLASVLDQEQLDQVLAGGVSDELGKLWSQTVARAAGVEYRHLGIDYHEHYTSMVIADAAGIFSGDTAGQEGARSFVVSNTEYLGNGDVEKAFDLLAAYAKLTMSIARGGHSILPADRKFVVTVTLRNEEDKARFARKWQEISADLDPQSYEVVYVAEQDLQGR